MLSCCVLQARVVTIFTVIFTRNRLEQAHEPSFRAIQILQKSGTTTEKKHLQKTKISHEKAHAFSLNLDVFVSLYPTQKNLHKFRHS